MPDTTAVVATTPAPEPGLGCGKDGKITSDLVAGKIAHVEAQKLMLQEITPEEPLQEPGEEPEPAPLSREELLGHRVAVTKCDPPVAAPPRLGWRSLSLRMAASWRTLAEDFDEASPPGLAHPVGSTKSAKATNKDEGGFALPLGGLRFRDDEDEDVSEQEWGATAAAFRAVAVSAARRGAGWQKAVPVDQQNPPPQASAIAGAWHDSLGNEIQVPLWEHDHVFCALITGSRGTKHVNIELDEWGRLHCGNGVLYQVTYAPEDAKQQCPFRLFWRTSDWRTSTWERTGVPPPGKGAALLPLASEGGETQPVQGHAACGGGKGKGKGGEKRREQGHGAGGGSKGTSKGKGGAKQQWRKRLQPEN